MYWSDREGVGFEVIDGQYKMLILGKRKRVKTMSFIKNIIFVIFVAPLVVALSVFGLIYGIGYVTYLVERLPLLKKFRVVIDDNKNMWIIIRNMLVIYILFSFYAFIIILCVLFSYFFYCDMVGLDKYDRWFF